ncbi:MAG: CopG family transcriptional regulator [Verrucomicrobiota bacterium]
MEEALFSPRSRIHIKVLTPTKYKDDEGEVVGNLHRVPDFFPKPEEMPPLEELAGKMGGQTKITLAVDDDALAFFRTEAKKRKTSYQRMIRNLVRAYALAHRR